MADPIAALGRESASTDSTVGMHNWPVDDVRAWETCRRLGVHHDFVSPDAELRCRYGREAKKLLRRQRRVHNAAVIAAAEAASEHATVSAACYSLRSQVETSEGCASPASVQLSEAPSKKRARYAGVPQPTAEQIAAFAPHGRAIGSFDDRLPWNHCGGDFYLASLVLADLSCCQLGLAHIVIRTS